MSDTTTTPTDEQRIAAYVKWASADADDLVVEGYNDDEVDGHRVLTDDEADEVAKEYIEQSLWAFNASFLVAYLPDGVGEEVIEALQPQCEGANDAIRSMVGDRFDDLVADAIGADGRGHFVSSYDGEEHEVDVDGVTFYIHRA